MEKEPETNYMNLKATELTLGLPGSDLPEKRSDSKNNGKRTLPEDSSGSSTNISNVSDARNDDSAPPPAKAQVVGWPPIRSYRKNNLQTLAKKSSSDHVEGGGILYVKVSMDGAPYLRKIDLKLYSSYPDLLKAMEDMFKVKIGHYSEREGYNGSDYTPTYEDKDGDWMLVGDVPWTMFVSTCKRLRIMKSSEAKGLGQIFTSSRQ